jgi:cell fate (sporulation/competence/biofilm development) regulator YlbF (YheA/YmcA/DUF963 family)
MQTTTDETAVLRKTKELCQAILDDPAMATIRQRITGFMENEQARTQYNNLVAKGQALQEKQQSSTPLTRPEVEAFEQDRLALLNNPVARGFLDAQEELHGIKHNIHQYVNLTLELGHMPTEDELEEHTCEGHENGGCCEH